MEERFQSLTDLESYRRQLTAARDPNRKVVALCAGTGCRAYGARRLAQTFREEIEKSNLEVELRITGCQGFCERGPVAVVHPQGIFYQRVKEADVQEIITETVKNGLVINRLLYSDTEGRTYEREQDVPFYRQQTKVLLAFNGQINPDSIDDYIAVGGYAALGKVLRENRPEEVVDLITRCGLRGRGGGGFPAGTKWRSCRKAPAADGVRYILCNGDEGDPGAFMDCSLMEGNPHLILEGMIIGAFAIGFPGQPRGYIYVRNEYPLAVERLGRAIEQARRYGLLGKRILGTELDFDVLINKGGGAFVCGESTALMASIEGFVGEPRAKHIHTAEQGLFDKPTNLNNVETWANVPLIVNRGLEWFTSIGTGDVSKDPWGGSKGTKIFALVGKVNNTGLVEVPMGATLRHIIYDVGGGPPPGKKFKAVQTGGPSGGCLPESLLDLPVDFDRLTEAGSMMGSGGMIVMDESTCMVDVARYFLHFLADESCGKCVSCREGLAQLCAIVDRICKGEGREDDLQLLKDLSATVQAASLCGLGQSAAHPLLSTMRYFEAEYRVHINEHRCPAKVCKTLIRYVIDENCDGCMACNTQCGAKAIQGEKKAMHAIDDSLCTRCGVCMDVCKRNAIHVES
jgi:NADH-quinone oxidoreductase subunit F